MKTFSEKETKSFDSSIKIDSGSNMVDSIRVKVFEELRSKYNIELISESELKLGDLIIYSNKWNNPLFDEVGHGDYILKYIGVSKDSKQYKYNVIKIIRKGDGYTARVGDEFYGGYKDDKSSLIVIKFLDKN